MFVKPLVALVLSALLISTSAFGATAATSEGTGTATTTAAPILPINGGTSINPSAQTGKKSQGSGAAMNMAAAAMLMAACMATQPPNMALCMMGAMAAMQGGEDKNAEGQSAATQSATNTSGASGTNATAPTYADAAAGTAAFEDKKKIAAGMTALKTAGYTATPAGISSAGGMVPASAFGSSGSMLAAGLDPNAVKEAEKISKDVSSKYGTMSMAADASGAGGGGGNESNSNGDSSSSSSDKDAYKNPFALGSAKKAEMMAGKTVQFDGEPIGVKGDDIFQMVHVAYDRKRNGQHFIETDHDPELGAVSVRAPASVVNPSPAIKPASVNQPPRAPAPGPPRK